eukprot:Hpha_TRINITY_DN6850_c0_g1::TRINITY_DN6850_c0_g1_i1::g.46262::m.46262
MAAATHIDSSVLPEDVALPETETEFELQTQTIDTPLDATLEGIGSPPMGFSEIPTMPICHALPKFALSPDTNPISTPKPAALEARCGEEMPTIDDVRVVIADGSDSEAEELLKIRKVQLSVCLPHGNQTQGSASVLGIEGTTSVLDMSTIGRSLNRTQRPFDEVWCSAEHILGLRSGAPQTRRRLRDLLEDVLTGDAVAREFGVFFKHLQVLLSTVFSQVAEFVEYNLADDGVMQSITIHPDDVEPRSVLGGIIAPRVVRDIVSAARLSLRAYHEHCEPLRLRERRRASSPTADKMGRLSSRSPGRMGRRSRNPGSALRASPDSSVREKEMIGLRGRRVSSVNPFNGCAANSSGDSRVLTVERSFVQALTEGKLAGCQTGTPKRRSSTRIERGDDDGSFTASMRSGEPSASIRSGDAPTATMRSGDGRTSFRASFQRGLRSPSPADLKDVLSKDSDSPIPASPCSTKCSNSKRSRAAHMELEKRLASLSTLQYFDVIVETLGSLLCVKYEEQIRSLTHEGETSGARRLAEWVTARVVEEMFNDGIDPSLPLDIQLLYCIEGFAVEEGVYHWRTNGEIDPAVAAAVWGTFTPADVREGLIETMDPARVWYEWGVFTK